MNLEETFPTEVEEPEKESVDNETEEGSSKEVTSESDYPGADVVEIVYLRGDETTVYKLADGTYMDRIERHFTYNGTDTWTDEDGVEWNEVAKSILSIVLRKFSFILNRLDYLIPGWAFPVKDAPAHVCP